MRPFFKRTGEGGVLYVLVTPKAARDHIFGPVTDGDGRRLKAAVRMAPEKGKANAALCKLLGEGLGLPKSAFEVISGHTSRRKAVRFSGDGALLEEKLAQLPDKD